MNTIRDPRNQQGDGDWYDLYRRITNEGWTASCLREFRRVTTPRIDIKLPHGIWESKPPTLPWEEIRLDHLGKFEVKFPEQYSETFKIPDKELINVLCIMEYQLTIASGFLGDIKSNNYPTPNLYPEREVNGENFVLKTS